ncbi:MAG: hypothetical protein ABEJ89_09570 [Haloarculaceae archaeon]
MNPLPPWLAEVGTDDPVFDVLLVAGPLVIALIAVLGRSLPTDALAAAYLLSFVGYVAYKGVSR